MAIKPEILITHQTNTVFAYRVEIKDNSGYGLGYGDTPRLAYADARRDYIDRRNSETRTTLKACDAQYKAVRQCQ